MDWLRACADFAHRECVEPRWLGVLEAFSSSGPSIEVSRFVDLEVPIAPLCERVEGVLSNEVDGGQAAMFSRRLQAVSNVLDGLGTAPARMLRVGLRCRVHEILEGPLPRALRVRACVDFYFSQAALLTYEDPAAPSVEALAEHIQWQGVAEGLAHARIAGNSVWGPLNINVLRVSRPRRIRCVDLRGRTGSFAEQVVAEGARAAVSGGFFLYSEPDIVAPSQRGDPVGLLIEDGVVVSPPVLQRTALWEGDAGWRISRSTLKGWTIRGQEVVGVNTPALLGKGLVAFNRAWPERVRWPHSLQLIGNRLVAGDEIPLNGALLCWPKRSPSPGPVTFSVSGQAMAGGPVLLREGALCLDLLRDDFAHTAPPITFSCDETYDQNLLPRMAVGIDRTQSLIFAAVDGRHFSRAPGLTLEKTARVLRALGCTEAMNLDGGSSKRMVIGGEVIDLPSTEVTAGATHEKRVRPVRSAILVH